MVDGSIVDVEQRANAASWVVALQHHPDVRGSIPVLDGGHKAPSGSEVEGGPVHVPCGYQAASTCGSERGTHRAIYQCTFGPSFSANRHRRLQKKVVFTTFVQGKGFPCEEIRPGETWVCCANCVYLGLTGLTCLHTHIVCPRVEFRTSRAFKMFESHSGLASRTVQVVHHSTKQREIIVWIKFLRCPSRWS